jgi:hypothetical protein
MFNVDTFVTSLTAVAVLGWLVLHAKEFGQFLSGIAAASVQYVQGIRGS